MRGLTTKDDRSGYDGKTVTVMDREKNLYAVADAPPTVDETLDVLSQKYGITVQLEDLIVADPYTSGMKQVTSGGYFGDEMVLGVPCRHVGFSTDTIDWQLWIAQGPQPLPQKLVITYKNRRAIATVHGDLYQVGFAGSRL